MNKISEQIPQDTVLDEIHSVQKKYSSERGNLTWIEEKNIINNKVAEFSKKQNILFKIIRLDEELISVK